MSVKLLELSGRKIGLGRAALAGAAVLGLMALGVGDAAAQVQDKGQQGCINQLNKGGAKVAATQGKENSGCVKNATKGKLSGTAENCLTADLKSKVSKATGKNNDGETKKCGTTPSFGATDAATGNAAAVSEELDLLHDIFGPDLDGAVVVIDKAVPQTKIDAGCQAAVSKAYEKLAATKAKQFLACKKAGLSGKTQPQVADTASLADCVGSLSRSDSIAKDPKGKIGKAVTKLQGTLTKKCTGVDTDVAFPGLCVGRTGTDFGACVDEKVECHVCTMLNTMDNMSADCDLFDDGLSNGSCGLPPDCCGFSQLKFTTGIASGSGGTLENFRCSNQNTIACVDDTDCDIGYCVVGPNFCSGAVSISCTSDADCNGTCGAQTGSGLPQSLDNGGLYTGGGLNSVPLPLPVPDQGESFMKITDCVGDTLSLGATTAAEAGSTFGCTTGRTCSGSGSPCVLDSDCPATQTCDTNCIFGPQLPIPNTTPGNEATSVCTINDVAGDASGTASCTTGSQDTTVPLRSNVYLNGDLLSSSKGPVDVVGVQPCPLCTRQCVGGTNNRAPCAAPADCNSGNCSAGTSCLGGPGDTDPCTPDTSDSITLGSSNIALPTSHDCALDPNALITSAIGGLPVDLALTTGSIVENAVDQPELSRTFSGFCQDATFAGSKCFEGDPTTSCPVPGDSNGVACSSDADCLSTEYPNCAQSNEGAFSRPAATRITVTGSPAGDLRDGAAHASTLVSVFDIAPTFNALVDSAGAIPGPGASLLQGTAKLSPSGAFIEMASGALD